MTYADFCQQLRAALPLGTVLPNPGGGTSTIVSYTARNVTYRRGHSRITMAWEDLYRAYLRFQGTTLDSTMLKDYQPRVFDSTRGGHSCNCTFLFLVLQAMGVVDRIGGAGRRGHPFQVVIRGG